MPNVSGEGIYYKDSGKKVVFGSPPFKAFERTNTQPLPYVLPSKNNLDVETLALTSTGGDEHLDDPRSMADAGVVRTMAGEWPRDLPEGLMLTNE